MTTLINLVTKPLTQAFNAVWGAVNRVDLTVYAKNDFVIQVSVVDEDGDAVDISTYTTRNFGVYPMASGTPSFSKTPAFATDGTNGVMTVTVADTDTTSLAGEYRLELQIAKTGAKETVLTGIIHILPSYVS